MWLRLRGIGIWVVVLTAAALWSAWLLTPEPELAPPDRRAARKQAVDWSRELGRDVFSPAVLRSDDKPIARWRLLGVIAPPAEEARGIALIETQAGPARAYSVGGIIEGDTVLQAVGPRRVLVGPRDGSASTALELSEPARTNVQQSSAHGLAAEVDSESGISPIVPPHTEMVTPRPSDSGTPASHYSRMRDASAATPGSKSSDATEIAPAIRR